MVMEQDGGVVDGREPKPWDACQLHVVTIRACWEDFLFQHHVVLFTGRAREEHKGLKLMMRSFCK